MTTALTDVIENTFPIIPKNGTIAITPLEEQEVSKGGVFLPQTRTKAEGGVRIRKGTVLAVGPGELLLDGTRLTPSVVPGDLIEFTADSGLWYERNGEPYCTLVNYRSIVAVIREEA